MNQLQLNQCLQSVWLFIEMTFKNRWNSATLWLTCNIISLGPAGWIRTTEDLVLPLWPPLTPVSPSVFAVMLLVDSGLYIGTAADLNDLDALRCASVTHILSVDSEDPAAKLPADWTAQHKWINVLDEATSDLLSHLDECFLFIREAVDRGGSALVHWWDSLVFSCA